MSARGATILGMILGTPLIASLIFLAYTTYMHEYDDESLILFAVLSLICLVLTVLLVNRVRRHHRLIASIEAGDHPYGFHVSPRYFCAYLSSGSGEHRVEYIAAHHVVLAQMSKNYFYSDNVSKERTLATILVERDGACFYAILLHTFVHGSAQELAAALRNILGAKWSDEIPFFDDEARAHQLFIGE